MNTNNSLSKKVSELTDSLIHQTKIVEKLKEKQEKKEEKLKEKTNQVEKLLE